MKRVKQSPSVMMRLKKEMIADYKVLLINASSFGISMTDIDIGLKIFLLLITIFYTLQKWWLMNKKKNDKEL
jgi:hypothetical protein